jgi:hypothetical protein
MVTTQERESSENLANQPARLLDTPFKREVVVYQTAHGYTVREGEHYANELCFDEMLGQLVELLHPDIGRPRYRMETAQEWQEWKERHDSL